MYNSEYQTNGTVEVLTRTDTNAAGTVTQVVQDDSRAFTVAYPDHLNYYQEYLTWFAVLPTTVNDSTCCQTQSTTSATPPLTSRSTTPGPTNTADPSGWLYTLVGEDGGAQYPLVGEKVSSVWDGVELTIPYSGCSYTTCGVFTTTTQLPPTYASSAAFLLETSTTTVSSEGAEDTGDPTEGAPSPPPTSSEGAEEPTPADPPPSSTAGVPSEPSESDTPPEATLPPGDNDDQPAPPPTDDLEPSESPTPPGTGDDLEPTASLLVEDGDDGDSDDGNTGTEQPPPAEDGDGDNGGGDDQTEQPPTSDEDDTSPGANQPDGTAPSPDSSDTPPQRSAVVEIGGQTITQQSDSAFIISSQTLSPGASITLGFGGATTIVAFETAASGAEGAAAAAGIVVGSSTAAVLSNAPALPAITVGSSVITANEASNYVIDGQTLAPGSAIVVNGDTTIELASGGTELVVDGSTQVIAAPSTAVEGFIWSALGGPSASGEPAGSEDVAGSETGVTVPQQTVILAGRVGVGGIWVGGVFAGALGLVVVL